MSGWFIAFACILLVWVTPGVYVLYRGLYLERQDRREEEQIDALEILWYLGEADLPEDHPEYVEVES